MCITLGDKKALRAGTTIADFQYRNLSKEQILDQIMVYALNGNSLPLNAALHFKEQEMLRMNETTMNRVNQVSTKQTAMIGICAAISFVLMFVKLPISYLGFLEMELSDIPAVIVTLIYGPMSGVLVELVKNLLHLMVTSTGMSGELSNFIISVGVVVPLGLVTRKNKSGKRLILGFASSILGLTIMGMITNYFVTVPLYLALFGKEAVMGMVQATIPSINSLESLVLLGITPFNIVKGLMISVLSYSLYKVVKDRI